MLSLSQKGFIKSQLKILSKKKGAVNKRIQNEEGFTSQQWYPDACKLVTLSNLKR